MQAMRVEAWTGLCSLETNRCAWGGGFMRCQLHRYSGIRPCAYNVDTDFGLVAGMRRLWPDEVLQPGVSEEALARLPQGELEAPNNAIC